MKRKRQKQLDHDMAEILVKAATPLMVFALRGRSDKCAQELKEVLSVHLVSLA